MAIRSGRFNGDATGASGIEIINGNTGVYRIFNSGKSEFSVYDDASLVETVPIECSVDVKPDGTISIRSASTNVEGIYELLTKHGAVRNGRFKLDPPTGTNVTYQILNEAKVNGFYRIMNSGDTHSFAVLRDGNSAVAALKPKMTIDIQAKQNSEITILASKKTEGIYIHLNQLNPVKSGRFKIDPAVHPNPDPAVDHPIINTDSTIDSYFRIFNSGASPFTLEFSSSSHQIAAGLSFDFKVDKKTTVIVKGLNSADAIEGILDYLADE